MMLVSEDDAVAISPARSMTSVLETSPDITIPFRREVVEDLLERYYRPRQLPLRGCHPRDLVEHVLSLSDYRETDRELTPELLDAACASYFVDERETMTGQSLWNVLPPK